MSKKLSLLLALVVVIGLLASACAPAATPTPVPPTAVPKPAEPTKAPAAPTAVPPTPVPPTAVPATKFPEKPITLVVHAAAGGGSDIFARVLSAAFEKDKLLAQPIVVENRAGGSGATAFAYVYGKKADPYFLLTAVTSFLTTPLLQAETLKFSYKDFTPIANFAFDEYMLMVKADSKYKSAKDIADAAKGKPKDISVGGTQSL